MALVYSRNLDEKTAFALWKIEEKADELLSQLQLKKHEREYLNQLNPGKRHLHWLSTRVLLRKMLATPAYIDCRIDEYGKPYLTNFHYHISLSHSFDYAAVMISEDKEVGIDIEQISAKIERIASKFMDENELKYVPFTHRIEYLYACWCAKEAVYKLHGEKNVSFKDHIKLQPFVYQDSGILTAHLNINRHGRILNVFYEKYGDYMISYCADYEQNKK